MSGSCPGSNGLGRQAEIIDTTGRRSATECGPPGDFLGRTSIL
ncbi:hypothetical protein ACFCZY_07690 [Streptomyces sp. NPDC056237]